MRLSIISCPTVSSEKAVSARIYEKIHMYVCLQCKRSINSYDAERKTEVYFGQRNVALYNYTTDILANT